MKKLFTSRNLALFAVLVFFVATAESCSNTTEGQTTDFVNDQQSHYNMVQPLHFYDYSIPKDVLQQIYDITTTEAVATYSVAETITGMTKWRCPSIGYAIPADTQLTNPVQTADGYYTGTAIGQPEPNGLFSSINTDGTWVLCVGPDGIAYPYYSEHKIQVWPFPVEKNADGEWVQIAGTSANVTVDTTKISQDIQWHLESNQAPP